MYKKMSVTSIKANRSAQLSRNMQDIKNLEFSGKSSASGDLPWDVGFGVKTLKLSIVLLVFLYSSDDHKISIFEKRSFKKEVSEIDIFTKEDKEELEKLLELLPDENYVLGYINKNQLKKDIVLGAIKYLRVEVGLNKEDRKLLSQFKKVYENRIQSDF